MAGAGNMFLAGLEEHLKSVPGVCDVLSNYSQPVSHSQLEMWEQSNCLLPSDLKQFYLTHNGVRLSWKYMFNGTPIELGRININPLSSVTHLTSTSLSATASGPSLLDLSIDTSNWYPSWDESCFIHVLDYCPTCGHTCLVTRRDSSSSSPSSSIWLLDLALSFHLISPSFTGYLRLAIVHWGLTQWPYSLTSNKLSPANESWFQVFIPKRLALDRDERDGKRSNTVEAESNGASSAASVDWNKLFTASTKLSKSEPHSSSISSNKKR